MAAAGPGLKIRFTCEHANMRTRGVRPCSRVRPVKNRDLHCDWQLRPALRPVLRPVKNRGFRLRKGPFCTSSRRVPRRTIPARCRSRETKARLKARAPAYDAGFKSESVVSDMTLSAAHRPLNPPFRRAPGANVRRDEVGEGICRGVFGYLFAEKRYKTPATMSRISLYF